MAYFLFTICATLALVAQFVQARPGSGMLSEGSNGRRLLHFSLDHPETAETEMVKLLVGETTETKGHPEHKKTDAAVQLKEEETQPESEKTEAEEDEVVCTEMGTCYEKRLLTATIDYKGDGPNDPITEPPH